MSFIGIEFVLPIRAKPKPRPQIGRGRAYYQDGYDEWRDQVRGLLRDHTLYYRDMLREAGALELDLLFSTDEIRVGLRPGKRRATHVRADADNLAGGIMDAMQDYKYQGLLVPGLITDDRVITKLTADLTGAT